MVYLPGNEAVGEIVNFKSGVHCYPKTNYLNFLLQRKKYKNMKNILLHGSTF